MKSSGSSPTTHRYQLGKLAGRSAGIIRDLNSRALLRFQPREIQAASWSIQNGVPLEEIPTESKKIIETVIPEHRDKLTKSFLENVSEKWNAVTEKFIRADELTSLNLKEVQKLFNQASDDPMYYAYQITEKQAPYFRTKYGRRFHFRKREYFLETRKY